MKKLQLKNDDYLGYVKHLRHACRGIVVHEGKILLGYEENNNKYIIPVRAKEEYLEIEELFLDWNHINHYFICELIKDTGSINLTKAEKEAGCTFKWLTMEEALNIFGRYEDYHQTNIADFGLYRREYFALKEYKAHVR